MRSRQLLLTALIALVCSAPMQAQGQRRTISEAPPWGSDIESASLVDILNYARGLPFDISPWTSDTQFLVYANGLELEVGPRVRIAARWDAQDAQMEALETGRFVARFESDGAVPWMGLVDGATYVYVDQMDDRWRVLLFPETVVSKPGMVPLLGDVFGEGSHYSGVLEGQMRVISLGDMCLPGADDGPQGARFLPVERRDAGITSMGCWVCDCSFCCMDGPFRFADHFRGPLDLPSRD